MSTSPFQPLPFSVDRASRIAADESQPMWIRDLAADYVTARFRIAALEREAVSPAKGTGA